jgi:hypothetical protein
MVTAQTARELLAEHGPVRSQQPTDWTGSFSLPTSLLTFYQEVGPFDVTIEQYGNPFFSATACGPLGPSNWLSLESIRRAMPMLGRRLDSSRA